MSDLALLRARRIFGYAAIVAVLVLFAVPVIGLGVLLGAIIAGMALASVCGWWWFGHSLEVREIAETFRDPLSGAKRSSAKLANLSQEAASREENNRES